MNRKLEIERKARVAAEQARDCARACAARAERPANGLTPTSAQPPSARGLAPRTFDSIFATFGHGLPVPYLRALALRESDMNPRESSGPAWGLLQVIEVVRLDYNQRTGGKYTRQDLLDPKVNVTIATSALATILHSYAQNHPRIKNLQADWSNPHFVQLLTFGWNAGWSERGGVGRVSKFLEQRGVLDQTLDVIHKASGDAGASAHLANPAKVAWSKSVAAQYFRELAAEQKFHGPVIEMPEEYVGRPPLVATGPQMPPEYAEQPHVIEMPPEYVGRPPAATTGPITHPSQVMTSSGPITSPSQLPSSGPVWSGPIAYPSQVTTSAPITAPSQVAPSPVIAPAATIPISAPSHPPTIMVAPPPPAPSSTINPSGLPGPINPYDDCACST
jgi:hypothetical protein